MMKAQRTLLTLYQYHTHWHADAMAELANKKAAKYITGTEEDRRRLENAAELDLNDEYGGLKLTGARRPGSLLEVNASSQSEVEASKPEAFHRGANGEIELPDLPVDLPDLATLYADNATLS